MSETYLWFAGIDWATQQHAVCVVAADGERVKDFDVDHSGAGLEQLVEYLTELCGGRPDRVAVGIEVSRGAVVETLLERGFHMFGINPKQLDRFRDRHTMAGAKSDRLDAFVLGDSLRSDRKLFRRLEMEDPTQVELREFTRTARDLQEDLARLSGQLRDLLLRCFPALLSVCPGADESWLWSLLKQAPTPAQAAQLSRRTVTKLLHDHRIRRITPDELLATLAAKPVFVAPGVGEAVSARLQLLLPRLRLVSEQRREVDRHLSHLLEKLAQPTEEESPGQKREHRDAEILLSLPGVGNLVAATMLAEAAKPLADRDYDTLRALGGQAPVARQTGLQGKHPKGRRRHPIPVVRRQACNPHLREALFHCSRVAAIHDPRAKAHYARLREAGHSHGRALRGVGDRLLRIFVGMLKSGTLYNDGQTPSGVPATQAA
jgi:transposase